VLLAALTVGGGMSFLMPYMPDVGVLALTAVGLGGAVATTGAMVFSLLATEVPAERRSTTLNLVYLPLYVAGIIGPALGAGVSAVAGAPGPFLASGVVFLVGAVVLALRRGSSPARRAGGT
jgi:MFS family permease